MNFSELSKNVSEKCPEVLKAAFQPVEASEVSGDCPTVTKFGGREPFRSSKFQWPKCSECEKQKTFICQINISSLPEQFKLMINRYDGLFQCFFCLGCMPYDGCFNDIYFVPESELLPDLQSLVSKFLFQNSINISRLPQALKSSLLVQNEVFKQWDWEGFEEKKVGGWSELKLEIPSIDEIIDDVEHKILINTNITEDELTDMEEDENSGMGFPSSGIKLGGYIRWCQGVEYPTCPDCEVMMTITFLQLDNTTLFPFMWGDSGTAHVTLCPQCGRPGLGWACC